VLDAAAITIPDDDGEADSDGETSEDATSGVVREREVQQFREFLDQISPEDFAAGG
jgi:hypothetical protein